METMTKRFRVTVRPKELKFLLAPSRPDATEYIEAPVPKKGVLKGVIPAVGETVEFVSGGRVVAEATILRASPFKRAGKRGAGKINDGVRLEWKPSDFRKLL